MYDRWTNSALLGGLLLSASVHAVPIANAIRDLSDLRGFVNDASDLIHDRLWTMYEVEMEKEKPKEEKPPEEKKDDAPPPVKLPPRAQAAPPPPPAAAQAGKTLTAPDDGKPVDFSDFALAQGNAETYAGGVTAANGTNKGPVYDRNARPDGTPGGTGKGPPPPAPVDECPQDQSRPASVKGGAASCPFPAEADQDDVNNATVMLVAQVNASGQLGSITVTSDPGHGFGRAARQCALTGLITFSNAQDRCGKPIVGTTAPFRVRFTR